MSGGPYIVRCLNPGDPNEEAFWIKEPRGLSFNLANDLALRLTLRSSVRVQVLAEDGHIIRDLMPMPAHQGKSDAN